MEHVKRYTTIGTAHDQGKTSGVNAIGVIAAVLIVVPVVLLASWHDADPVLEPGELLPPRRSVKTFFALLLVLETMMIGVFAATDVFLFYVFFEAMLIPMYFLIGSYGGPKRSYAAVKFLLYSLFGGLLMLAAVIGLYVASTRQGPGTFSFEKLTALEFSHSTQILLFLGFFIAFAIKAPLFPFHTWLPDAGAEAPVGGALGVGRISHAVFLRRSERPTGAARGAARAMVVGDLPLGSGVGAYAGLEVGPDEIALAAPGADAHAFNPAGAAPAP